MVVYDIGTYPAKEKLGQNIYPGWILIKNSEDIKHAGSNEGQVHGDLTMSHFKIEPSVLQNTYNVDCVGFSIRKGLQYEYTSTVFNKQSRENITLRPYIRGVIEKAIRQGKVAGATFKMSEIDIDIGFVKNHFA